MIKEIKGVVAVSLQDFSPREQISIACSDWPWLGRCLEAVGSVRHSILIGQNHCRNGVQGIRPDSMNESVWHVIAYSSIRS